jgi:hypothetical protein
MALHAPSLHFHLGAWAVTAVCTFAAFWINFLQKRDLIPNRINKYIHPDTVARLEYVAHVTGVVGLLGVFLALYTGFLDASGIRNVSPLDINAFFIGIDRSLTNPILAFKVQWTLVGVQAFIFAGILRFYFVNIKGGKSVYDEHYAIQMIYAEATLLGFFLMMIVAGAGGIWVYGESILSGIPILQDFLPGGNLLVPMVTIVSLFTLTFLLSVIFEEKVSSMESKKTNESESH